MRPIYGLCLISNLWPGKLGFAFVYGDCLLSTTDPVFSLRPNVGTKYDLDYKFQNKSGQNFKSGDDMIKMYEELCAGIYMDTF
jgi:hypothetical protein